MVCLFWLILSLLDIVGLLCVCARAFFFCLNGFFLVVLVSYCVC